MSDIINHRQTLKDNASKNKKLVNELPKNGMSANMQAHNFKKLQEQISGKEDLEKFASNSKK